MIKFTSIFGVVMAGSLAVLGSQFADTPTKAILALSMVMFSIFGFLYMHVCRIPWLVFSRLAEAIMTKEFKLAKYERFETYRKFVNASFLFHSFYIINVALFFALFVYNFSPIFSITNFDFYSCLTIIAFIVVISIMSIFYLTKLKSLECQIKKNLKKRLQQSDEATASA